MLEAMVEIQFSVFLVNKPGILAQVTGALADEKIRELMKDKQTVKIVVVPGKLVNIVVRG